MKYILCFFLAFFIISVGYSQAPSLFKFGNAVFYEISSFDKSNIDGSVFYFDKEIENHFVDLYLKNDSAKIIIHDSTYCVRQDSRARPRNKKELFLYASKPIYGNNIKVKSLKVISLKNDTLIAEGNVVYTAHSRKKRQKTIVKIAISQLEGVVIGYGKNFRHVVYAVYILGGVVAIFLIL